MNRKVWIEGMILLGLGLLSAVEGLRLDFLEKVQLYDVLGPGNYNVGLGLALILIGIVYIAVQRKSNRAGKGERK